jgi:hypothetical protein
MNIQRVQKYLNNAIKSFDGDPPDGEFLCGYLAALETVRDDLFKTQAERATAYAERAKK